ncbi:interleukin-17 receptor A-like [Anguilla anguilla]|uniref:interleukin-17 receptor A-like n=1 Tax=Anguilla anguilla TaxID=7936 RepID=UPI0015ACC505|nr:interleukin-17 receptor A-like [Anguilla anguilla]
MYLIVYSIVLLSVHATLTSGLRILQSPPLNCTQEGLRCTANINNCLDQGWLRPRKYTPTDPKNLTVKLDVREDENGDLVPVLLVNWAAQIDGSIKFMDGTEVYVLEMSINLNRCVRYIFANKITHKKNSPDEPWSFSLDRLVVDPDQKYIVSVNNLPKPNLNHDSYNVSKEITIPGCADAIIKKTKKCVESGSLWKSNISLEMSKGQDGKAAITVGFDGDTLSEKYSVAVQCVSSNTEYQTVKKSNRTSLKATFALGMWPRTCCHFKVEIQPFFVSCQNDCIRRWKKFNICPSSPTLSPGVPFQTPLAVGLVLALGVVLLCGIACCAYFHCGKLLMKDQRGAKISQKDPDFPMKDSQDKPSTQRKVLLIYSLDHPLYRDVVLKLCAFLTAKCGTEVVLDLLDSAWLGAVGRMQWLDWQKQQIEKSSDKILILCSRGVRAKWRAMCGEGRVMLREDLRSPMGDMLTPALSLIAPDLLRAAALEKYIVAYFEDVSSEEDVPAPFNITVKYKLMKHFEELYFRILDQEKHEPGRVNRIEGIAPDEYFNCPSGRALRDAIETLQAYQLENPDWFEKECVDSEEEVAESELQHPLLADTCGDPVFQCVPEFKEGPPVLVNEVEFNEDDRGVRALIPLVNQGGEGLSIYESHPGICAEQSQVCSSHSLARATPGVLDAGPSLFTFKGHRPVNAEPALCEPAAPRVNRLCRPEESPGESCPGEEEEEEEEEGEEEQLHASLGPPSQESLQRLRALQESLCPIVPARVEDESVFDVEGRREWIQEKRPQSGSDQGYISRSLLQDSTLRQGSADPLDALSKLQEACLLNSLAPSSGFPDTPSY